MYILFDTVPKSIRKSNSINEYVDGFDYDYNIGNLSFLLNLWYNILHKQNKQILEDMDC